MNKVVEVDSIADPYTKRILSYVLDKNPLKIYAKTPGRLRKALKGLDKKDLRKSPVQGKWSIGEIVVHMCDTELVLGFRLRMAFAQSGSSLQAIDEKLWAAGLGYDTADVKKKLELFTLLREDHIAMVSSLTEEQLARYGMHQERGKETIERMVQMYAGHDINHLRQIEMLRTLLLEKKSKRKKK